jgi:hypothetical protein
LDGIGWVPGMAGVAGSIHINSIVLFFLLSDFLIFFFHPIILLYFYVCMFAYFHKSSAHEQYVFRHEDISEMGMKQAMNF